MKLKLGFPMHHIDAENIDDFNSELLNDNLKKCYLICLIGVIFIFPLLYLDWIRYKLGIFDNPLAIAIAITHQLFILYLPIAIYISINYKNLFNAKAQKKRWIVFFICMVFTLTLLPMGILAIPNGGTIVVYGIYVMLINFVISINHFFRKLVNFLCICVIVTAVFYFKSGDMNQIITSILEAIGITLPAYIFATIHYNTKVKEYRSARLLEKERDRSDQLLFNILPYETAQELKRKGSATPQYHEKATILFTDFENFSAQIVQIEPIELLRLLNDYFVAFDAICKKWNLEKIKTIGDAYMAVSGVPIVSANHGQNACNAALEIQEFVHNYKKIAIENHRQFFDIRIGIHSGPVISGVVGSDKFTFDIWGNAVNIASRMESQCETGKINISGDTYFLIKKQFKTTYRGHQPVKKLGEIEMYYLENYLEK
jgi:class 3 adenylate cyclase